MSCDLALRVKRRVAARLEPLELVIRAKTKERALRNNEERGPQSAQFGANLTQQLLVGQLPIAERYEHEWPATKGRQPFGY